MRDTDLTTPTSDHGARPSTATVTANRQSDRIRWMSVVAGAVALVFLPVVAACSDDADPSAPTSVAPPVETFPAPPSGAGVPLEPGSNLPPGAGDGIGDGEG